MLARRTEELFYTGMPYVNKERYSAVVNSRPRSYELYNIRNDPGELYNLARIEKQRFQEMQKKLDEYLKDVQKDYPDWNEELKL